MMWMHEGGSFLIIPPITRQASYVLPIFACSLAITADGVFARATLAMHFGIMHSKVNRLE